MITRRLALAGTGIWAGSLAATGPLTAQGGRPVQVVVTFPAGTPPDLVARTLTPGLGEAFGRNFVVENRAGAGGNIGTDAVAKAAPDEATLLIATNGPITNNKALYGRLPYDPVRDLAPVSLLVSAPLVLVVDPKLPIRTLSEFVAYAKAHPGEMSYGSTGTGSAVHLTMEVLKGREGIDVVHVPYRGSPAATNDILGGRIQALFAIATGVLPLVNDGKLRAIAVTNAQRLPVAPEIPTVLELGRPELESAAWVGLFVPAGTAPAYLGRLHGVVAGLLARPEIRNGFVAQGYEVVGGDPASFRGFIASETAKWTAVIERIGAKATE